MRFAHGFTSRVGSGKFVFYIDCLGFVFWTSRSSEKMGESLRIYRSKVSFLLIFNIYDIMKTLENIAYLKMENEQFEFIGVVISDKMQKTVVVKTMHLTRHAKYSKTVKLYNKFEAHDEKGIAKLGDTVLIKETRPLSKDKHFIVKQVLKKAENVHLVSPEEIV